MSDPDETDLVGCDCASCRIEDVEAERDELRAQRDQLLEVALEQVAEYDKRLAEYRAAGDHHVAMIVESHHGARIERARDAIAKALPE